MSEDILENIEKQIRGQEIAEPEVWALLIEIEKLKTLRKISNNIEALEEVLTYLNNNVYEIKVNGRY